MKLLAAIFGISLAFGLVAYVGMGDVSAIILQSGWGLAGVAVFHLATLILPAAGWRSLFERPGITAAWQFILARLLREGVNNLIAIAQVDGEVAGARLLALWGLSRKAVSASVIVDLTVEILAQIVFTALGLGLLPLMGADVGIVAWLFVGLALATVLVAGFFLAQRLGLFRWLELLSVRLATKVAWLKVGLFSGLHDEIEGIYRRPSQAMVCGLWHLAAWIAGAGEIWIAFHAIGVPLTFVQAVAYESLVQAARSAGFFVPLGLGIQETGYMAAAALFGIAPDLAFAAALIKRGRDLVLGVPVLLIWQFVEWRNWGRKAKYREIK